jgi:outer membrane murein-binding lipoprotein Lpp
VKGELHKLLLNQQRKDESRAEMEKPFMLLNGAARYDVKIRRRPRQSGGITMKSGYFLIVLLMIVATRSSCLGQMSPEEAEQKLQQKIAAGTQPDTLEAQIKSLQAQIDDLKQQLAAANAENAQLKAKLGIVQPAAPVSGEPAIMPQSTFTARAKTFHWSFQHNPTVEVSEAEKTDADIDALAAQKGLKPDMVAAMHEGKPIIGMPEEGLKIIMDLKKQADSASGSVYLGWPKQQVQIVRKTKVGLGGVPYISEQEGVDYSKWSKITVQNGVVTEIDAAQ